MEFPISIQFFGNHPTLLHHGQETSIPLWSSAAIAAVLSIRKGRDLERSELAEIIWPDFTAEARMANLRQAIKRLKEILPSEETLLVTRTHVGWNPNLIQSQFDQLDLLYRSALKEVENGHPPVLLDEYWHTISQPVFLNWPSPFFESIATRFHLESNELGLELSKRWEEHGQIERAIGVLEKLLAKTPTLVEASQCLLRLVYLDKGEQAAMLAAETVQTRFRQSGSSTLPEPIVRAVESIRKRSVEKLPQPTLIEKRSQILLLTRLFEENLKSGDSAAIELLVHPANEPILREHPRAFLSLAETTLAHSSGYEEARCKLIWVTLRLASYCSEYPKGHAICEQVLGDPDAPVAIRQTTLRMRAFMHFEQRRYDVALSGARESVKLAEQAGLHLHRAISVQNLGGILAHIGEFDEADHCFDDVIAASKEMPLLDQQLLEPLVAVNRCLLFAAMGEFERAKNAFDHVSEKPGEETIYRRVGGSWYGYALVQLGDVDTGAERILSAISDCHEHGFRRQLQIGIDFLAASLGALGHVQEAQTILDACAVHRKALHHDRSNLEIAVIRQIEGLRPEPNTWESALYANDPLSSLIKFGTDALERAVARA